MKLGNIYDLDQLARSLAKVQLENLALRKEIKAKKTSDLLQSSKILALTEELEIYRQMQANLNGHLAPLPDLADLVEKYQAESLDDWGLDEDGYAF